jgi:hypothetical protein
MEEILLKWQKELEDFIMEVGNVYRTNNEYKGKLIIGMHKWIEIWRSRWPLIKNYKSFWSRLGELRLLIMIVSSHRTMSIRNIITLFWVKLKALSMEEKYVDIL